MRNGKGGGGRGGGVGEQEMNEWPKALNQREAEIISNIKVSAACCYIYRKSISGDDRNLVTWKQPLPELFPGMLLPEYEPP